MEKICWLAILPVFLCAISGNAATITATGSGGWYSTAPDSPWPGGVVPATTDDAIITSGVQVSSAVTINNLTINGGGTFFNSGVLTVSGGLTLGGTVHVQEGAAINIAGNLNIANGTQFDPSCNPMSVGGLTTVSGTLVDLCGGGGLTDTLGDVIVDSTGQWKLTDVTQWSVSGNVVNNGSITVTSGGITFVGTSKTISGNAFSIPNMVVSGTVENDTTMTVVTSLSGAGMLKQGTNSTLTLGGTVAIAALDASAAPNTVNYNRNGAQSVAGPAYFNLNLSGGNTKTVASATAIGGDLHVFSPVRANVNSTVTVSGTTTVDLGATLSGTGTLNGAVVVNGTVSPGVTIGTLTLGSTPSLNGTNLMQLNRTNAPTADQLAVSGQPVAYGGTLTVQNLGPALVAGDSFQLFSASGYSGAFITVTLPTLGANLAWTNTLAANGTISVFSTASPGSPRLTNSVSGGNLILSWDTATFPGFALQGQTNAGGLSANWGVVPGGNVSPFSVPIDRANRSVFFRLYKP
jgi:hypothetical protein